MTTQPLVSVVIIFLNGEPYLEEAIASVAAQTYPAWQLLLVDDGSTDGSSERAQRHAARDPDRIRYLAHDGRQNHGMSASRNLGIREARGDYIAFLDADDVWTPNKLADQVELLANHPNAAMVYGATLYWHGWSNDANDAQRDYVQAHRIPVDRVYPPRSLVPLYLRGAAAVPCPTSVLIREAAVRAVGGFENSFRGLYEDQVFFSKICLQYPVFVAEACWDQYRQHGRSISAQEAVTAQLAARSKYLTWLAAYLERERIDDADLSRTVRLEQWLTGHPRMARMLDRARNTARYWRGRLQG